MLQAKPNVYCPKIKAERLLKLQKIQLAAARVRIQIRELQDSFGGLEQAFRKEVDDIAKQMKVDHTKIEFNVDELCFVPKKPV
jgi:hypothetical protein